jgi:hypothetical protein
MMSGWRFGTVGLTAELAALVLLLPLSNCAEKKFVDPSVGKTTELGTNCCGFSSATPNDHQSAA